MTTDTYYSCPRCGAPIQAGQRSCTYCSLPLDPASLDMFYKQPVSSPSATVPYPTYQPGSGPQSSLPKPRRSGLRFAGIGCLSLLVVIIGFYVIYYALYPNRGTKNTAAVATSPTSVAANDSNKEEPTQTPYIIVVAAVPAQQPTQTPVLIVITATREVKPPSTPATAKGTELYSFSGKGFASGTGAFHLEAGDYQVDWTAYYAGGDGSAEQRKSMVVAMMESLQRDGFGYGDTGMKSLVGEYIFAGETLSGTVPVTTGTGDFEITIGGATDAWTLKIRK
jgi:hypothetical protein